MRFTVLSGSPTGEKSVTLQSVRYLERCAPGHVFEVFHVGATAGRLERHPEEVDRILTSVAGSDAVLWVFPVYYALVPAQLKLAIEHFFRADGRNVFRGKYASTITTSVHFYDHTAHDYVQAVSEDLGLVYVPGLSQGSEDLLTAQGRGRLLTFFEHVVEMVEGRVPHAVRFGPAPYPMPEYRPGEVAQVPRTDRFRVVLVTDQRPEEENLGRMIEVFRRRLPNEVEVVHLEEAGMRGGCLGCLRCAFDDRCVYNDGHAALLDGRVVPADALVMAGAIHDRFMSSRAKMFLDRGFYHQHRPIHEGKQLGFLISGPLRHNPQMRQALAGLMETGATNLVGFVSDEDPDPAVTTAAIDGLCRQLMAGLRRGLKRPATYLGVGGQLIFRDLVFEMKNLFYEDYKFYKKAGHLDYPLLDLRVWRRRLLLGTMRTVPALRRKMRKQILDLKLDPYRRAVKRAGA